MLSHFTGLRIFHKDPAVLLSFLRLGHNFPLKVLSAYAALILISRGVSALAPVESSRLQSSVACPDGYAIRLAEDDRHPGRYVLCEEYDTYQELVEAGEVGAAKELTHGLGRRGP